MMFRPVVWETRELYVVQAYALAFATVDAAQRWIPRFRSLCNVGKSQEVVLLAEREDKPWISPAVGP